MSWLCCGNEHGKKIYPYSVYEQFSRREPLTKDKLQIENIKYGTKIDVSKYDDWTRIKYKSRNYNDIYNDLKNKKQNFIDEDFPHNSESISRR